MKKQEFLNAVRLGINNKSQESLKQLVLAFAKLIARGDFDEALSLLDKSEMVMVKSTAIDLPATVQQLCESVRDGAYDLSWDYEESYYNNYYSDEETLTDHDGLGEEIQALLELAVTYVNEKRYAEAFFAFDELFSLSITVKDYDSIGIDSLFSNGSIQLDMANVLLYYAYTAVMTLRSGERVQKLYDIMQISYYKLTIQDVALAGNDPMPEHKAFATQWVAFLLTKDLYHHNHILLDAVLFSGGLNALHDFTVEYGTKYQAAYIRLTEMYIEAKKYSEAVCIVFDGFTKLSGINNTRTKIADLLLNIGNATEDQSLIDKAIWEGFVSSADLCHYIAIRHTENDDVKEQAIDYLNSLPSKPADYNYIRFLHGDYKSVYSDCASDKSYLDWSTSEKGKVIPLFISLLAKKEAEKGTLSPCIKKVIASNFYNSDVKDVFFQALAESYKDLSDAEWKSYYSWCLKEIEGRVETIVRGQYRGSYDEVSALIVAMAEAMRASGDKNGAERYIIGYKEKYPRHLSFRKCLLEDIGLAKFGRLF